MTARRAFGLPAACAVLLGVLAAAPVAAQAAHAPRTRAWATINICDSDAHPGAVGIRGSMPGTGERRDVLYVRLRVQYQTADGRWRRVGRAADSGLISLGHGAVRARQGGRTFVFARPAAGRPAFVLRGVATFVWRRGGRVVRRVRRVTESGHPGTQGADPASFSAATCTIR